MRPREMLVTKSQVLVFFQGWGCTEPIPGKGKKVLVAFPCRQAHEVDLAEVALSDKKSDRGERLWSLLQSSRAGRQFEADVQEAHVLAYRQAMYEAHLVTKAGERISAEVETANEDLPLWAGAKAAYTAAYAMLNRMAKDLGHVSIKRDPKGRPVGSVASPDMLSIIEALNKGNEEQVKGFLALGRSNGWAAA